MTILFQFLQSGASTYRRHVDLYCNSPKILIDIVSTDEMMYRSTKLFVYMKLIIAAKMNSDEMRVLKEKMCEMKNFVECRVRYNLY